MPLLEFLQFVNENWPWVIFFCVVIPLILYVDTIKYFPSGRFDAFHFFYAFNIGISYGVVVALFVKGYIESYYFFIILYFGIIFHLSLKYIFKKKLKNRIIYKVVDFFKLSGRYKNPFNFILVIFILLVIIQIFTIGISAFTEVNRFEDAKGLGFLIRIIEPLKLIVISSFFIKLIEKRKKGQSIKWSLTLFITFCVFLALLSGAKFALIEILLLIGILLPLNGKGVKLGFLKLGLIFIASLGFVLFILFLNNRENDNEESMLLPGTPIVVDKLFLRLLSDGDMYYLSLPNGVIDDIQTDNVIVRFTSQVFGNSLTSKILGYDVSRFTVGKAIQVYHHESLDVSGGPVSHIDLFSYKYFGFIFGTVFIILLLKYYKVLSDKIQVLRDQLILEYNQISAFNLSIFASLWMRSLPILMEPPVGIAYVIDFFILILFLKVIFKQN